jgi:hypothetical protein
MNKMLAAAALCIAAPFAQADAATFSLPGTAAGGPLFTVDAADTGSNLFIFLSIDPAASPVIAVDLLRFVDDGFGGQDQVAFGRGEGSMFSLINDVLTAVLDVTVDGDNVFDQTVTVTVDFLGAGVTDIFAIDVTDSEITVTGNPPTVAPVPLPGALALALGGFALLGAVGSRRARA